MYSSGHADCSFVIAQSPGPVLRVEVEVLDDDAIVGDIYLLCSDGLSDMVSDEEIHTLLLEHANDKKAAAKQLISLANSKGGSDNISVILVSIHEAFSDNNGLSDSVG